MAAQMAVVERATRVAVTRRAWMGDPALARRVALIAGAVSILALCLAFHVWRLASSPGWDPQEGYNLDIAANLAHGQARLFALRSAFAQHPPLFYLQLTLAIRLFGYRILAVRALAALYAVLTCAAVIGCGRRLVGTGAALWAGVLFTAAPLMLVNTRWGYSYAQLAFFGVLCLWAAWRYEEHHEESGAARWLMLAAALAGIAAFSDYIGVAWIAFVALVALRHGWRRGLLALGIGAGILLAGLLVCFALAPGVFFADFAATFGRAGGGNLLVQLLEWLLNYYRLLIFDPVIVLGVAGFFLVRERRARGFLLGAFALLALVTLKVRPLGPSFHTGVPLVPLLALGAGVALDRALRTLYAWALGWADGALAWGERWMEAWRSEARARADQSARARADQSAPKGVPPQSPPARAGMRVGAAGTAGARVTVRGRVARLAAALVVFVAVVSPVGMALATDAAGIAATLPTRQDATLGVPADANAAFGYVLAHTRAGDLVLASPTLAWRFDAPPDAPRLAGADILQTIAQSGRAIAFYPAGLSAARWAYGVSLSRARFVVVDDLTRQLATPDAEPSLVPMLAAVERWPAVFTRGQYTVYERPGA